MRITISERKDIGYQEVAWATISLMVINDLLWSLPGGLHYLVTFRVPRPRQPAAVGHHETGLGDGLSDAAVHQIGAQNEERFLAHGKIFSFVKTISIVSVVSTKRTILRNSSGAFAGAGFSPPVRLRGHRN